MQVEIHGAAGGVTGSMHLVRGGGSRVLLDCGIFQGHRDAQARNAAAFPFDAAGLSALVLSHAHLDHIGRVPVLCRAGYAGLIHAQEATASLLPIMLHDSAGIAESDAERANRRRRKGEEAVVPLFTHADVDTVLSRLRPLSYDERREVAPGVTVRLRDAGHILGAAIVEVWADGRKLVFSGDLGPTGTPILRDPVAVGDADLVLLESTYGDREHRDRDRTVGELGEILETAWRSGGVVLIPAFAVGRSQELLYRFAAQADAWQMDRWRIFLDSPMAAKVVDVYARHQDLFDAEARAVWSQRPSPFEMPNLRMTRTTEESMAINRLAGGAIIVAGSGMATGGRILHHFRHRLDRRETHVIFVGYQAEGTLGRRLVDGARWVRIHGSDIRVNAQVHTVGGLSAHAGQQALLAWYANFKARPPLALVHGEERAREALAGEVHERFGVTARLPLPGDVLDV
ncbi:MBL fold metallo-hydrolase [Luteimonas vadosa]|uniref:MBL fold metallo-hydrolase n=1 Tax=Luteimonas vadosa TaxID=1165507 RepID=A0ABP9E5Z3_9GAMM